MAIGVGLLLKSISGQLGKDIVIKQYGDKTVVCKYPDMSNRKPTEKQKKTRETIASRAATHVIANDVLRDKAQVRLNVLRNKLYNALVKEYFQLVKTRELKKHKDYYEVKEEKRKRPSR